MRKLRRTAGYAALLIAAATGVALYAAPPVSTNWATGPTLGSVAVSIDGHVIVFHGTALTDTEAIDVAGSNYGLAFDNGLNLAVANVDPAPASQVVRLAQPAGHSQSELPSADAARSIVFAGDGTLYVGSAGGNIRRYSKALDSYTDFQVAVEESECLGIDLGADQKTLYIVSGGRNVFMLSDADTAAGDQVANTQTFTAEKKLSGSGNACGIRLAPPERGSSEKRHGGMFVADRVDIKRLNSAGLETSAFKGTGSGQNWVDVAIDPRMVYDSNNPASGVDPNEYVFWGVDAGRRRVARFQTTASAPQLTVSTGLEVPKGIAVNGELRVAQAVRLLTLGPASQPGASGTAAFLEGTAYPHTWTGENLSSSEAELAVMAFEFTSDGSASATPVSGRCAPSLDVDCRFVNSFSEGSAVPVAVAYSRGRAAGYRVVRFDPLTPAATGRVTIAYADGNPAGGGPFCGLSAGAATSVLRDPYFPTAPSVQNGHDQFEFDNTLAFFDFDDGVNTETVPDMGTDYVVVVRTDVKYLARLQKPDPTIISSTQLGASQPIILEVRDPNNGCQPVDGLANDLVLTVTELGSSATTTKGTRVGDSLTPGSLGVNGLGPWSFGNEWRSNLAMDPPQFKEDTYYAICVNTRAIANVRLTNDACAIVKPVKGPAK